MNKNKHIQVNSLNQYDLFSEKAMSLSEINNLIAQYRRAMYEAIYKVDRPKQFPIHA